ncbi:MAG: hypothetical protein Kow0062_09050 [Acidobacteriota bacterium]|nr:MAG: hypothetical protein D6738_13850 [Acidobacteriota bacterium]
MSRGGPGLLARVLTLLAWIAAILWVAELFANRQGQSLILLPSPQRLFELTLVLIGLGVLAALGGRGARG